MPKGRKERACPRCSRQYTLAPRVSLVVCFCGQRFNALQGDRRVEREIVYDAVRAAIVSCVV